MARHREIKYGVVPNVFEKNTYKDYTYYIVEGFISPTAYVVIPKGGIFRKHPIYKKKIDDLYNIPAHGGITYKGDSFVFDNIGFNNFIIGWDYAHGGDFIYIDEEFLKDCDEEILAGCLSGHKYKYKEILDDIKCVIDYLEENYK